ncbi:MAG TPA: hypothetical protein VHE35_26760, partial [Kofleriaceae bacterium]|nr:hypothetical protein [Kofleriaceae bacterium]
MSDDLDQLIRKAASAHLALAPASVLTTPGVADAHDENDLVARAMRRLHDPAYLAQLAPLDPEAVMMSEPDHDPDRDPLAAAPPATPSTGATDDSGLHDIRALAHTAKLRISRKMPAITEADDELVASTTGQLKAIALPEPARLVSLPDLPQTADAELARATALKIEARGGSATAAAELTAFEQARPKKRTALWVGLGGVAVAAAVVAVVMAGGSKKKTAAGAGDGSAVAMATGPRAPTIEAVPTA